MLKIPSDILSKTNIIILISIAITAIALSIFSFQYYTFTSTKILDIASHEAKTNSQIQAHDLSQTLSNKFESINDLLQTLADSPAIHNNEYKRADIIINTRQQYSNELTDFYLWINKDGITNWISNINQSLYPKYKVMDLSNKPYFYIPKYIHKAYYSSLLESNDKIPRLYISYPIINNTFKYSHGLFTGVVVASMRATTLGTVLQHQLLPQFNSTVGLVDRKGIILYWSNSSFIGNNIFEKYVQSMLSSSLSKKSKDSMNKLINDSLHGERGSGDITINGKINTISYEPVKINDKYFLTLYVISPHNLASDVGKLINQQRNFSIIIIIIIATVAFGISSLIILWNKRLKTIVDKRTSDLKTANELLMVHDKMQKEFINVASHEIKTPTHAILGFSDLLQNHPENRDQICEGISRNAKRLYRLTNDILDVTKIESQTLKLYKEQFDLTDVLCTILKDFNNDIQKKNINIKLLFNSNIHVLIEADKERLVQVISNIVNNAIKFSKETDGNIFINITVQKSKNGFENKVLITIKDDGIGIDSDIMPRLFTKFTTKSDTGIGLGLFISKSIIEAHNGKIWAENNSDGIGATFYFILPSL